MTKLPKTNYLRVLIAMPEKIVEYLDRLSLKAKMTGGRKLRVTEMVRAMVSACFLENSEVDFTGVNDEEKLRQMRPITRYRKGLAAILLLVLVLAGIGFIGCSDDPTIGGEPKKSQNGPSAICLIG